MIADPTVVRTPATPTPASVIPPLVRLVTAWTSRERAASGRRVSALCAPGEPTQAGVSRGRTRRCGCHQQQVEGAPAPVPASTTGCAAMSVEASASVAQQPPSEAMVGASASTV